MRLKKYQKKRNFKKSPEPKGKIKSNRSKKLYVIQKHDASHLHYDFRLELNGVLLSWAVPKGPCLDPTVKRLAVHVEDHPIAYGNFEGVIPKGQYGGGTVLLWDKGEWISEDANPGAAYAKGDMTFTLNAVKLKGRWKLIRMNRNDKTWLLIKVKDEYARSLKQYDILEEEPGSVLSHARRQINTDRFPSAISPQLATLVDAPPSGKEWLHEVKFDGYRILAYKHNKKTSLFTRNKHDWTKKFKSIADAINSSTMPDGIFDGEIVVLDKQQRSNFQLLQNSLNNHSGQPFIYYIFDLLYSNDRNLMNLPLTERKSRLKKLFKSIKDPHLRYSDHIIGSGKKVFEKSCKLGLEGIVSKEVNSIYIQKRGKNWLKAKCLKRQEFVIGGYTKPQHSRQYFGSLLLGTFNKHHELEYNGNVGTGFSDASLKNIYQHLIKNQSNKMPFNKQPPGSKNARWVKPVLVAEVEFTEWTQANSLRHPSFKGLRKDKPASMIKMEKEQPTSIIKKNNEGATMPMQLTNPDKIIYQEDKIDKLQLYDYYQKVSKWILPFVKNRALTLVRCPDTYKKCFYQKHIDKKYAESLHTISIKEKNKKADYFYIDEQSGLLTLPQLGVLEIHPWNSTIEDLEYPDMLVFDLDPAPGISWKKIVAAAFELKAELAQLNLRSFVKTTGGKGLHVVVPIIPEYGWQEVKNFAHVFVDYLMKKNPKLYVTNMSKSSRSGKIFLDYLRNQRGATAIAPYSTRAIIHAPVATPLHWDELTNDKRDTLFTIKTIPQRLSDLKKDPWRDFFKLKQSLRIKERMTE